jgi:hypothetical protein
MNLERRGIVRNHNDWDEIARARAERLHWSQRFPRIAFILEVVVMGGILFGIAYGAFCL